jgi:CelD/BcsL family acetyltransferase involved in cellulose biosynthesis
MGDTTAWTEPEQSFGSVTSKLVLIPQSYRVTAAPVGARSPSLDADWRSLLQGRDPVNAVHQTPAYIEHLADSGRSPEILVVRDGDERVAGIVPVRRTGFVMSFSLRNRTLVRLRLRSLIVLGSEPMVVDDRRALDELFSFIADHYREAQVVEMYSVREDGAFWRYLTQSEVIARRYGVYVVGGFRESFSVALPGSVDEYLKKMSKKRRYNLKRQERLLEEHLGAPLELQPVLAEADLPVLIDALSSLGVSTGPDSKFTVDQYRSAARKGILRCFVLSCAGQTVGIATGIGSENAFFVHDLYFNKALAKFSPGTTLWQVLIRHLIEQGVFSRVGISPGSPAYRFDEVNQIEQKGRVLLYRRTLPNRLRFLAHSAHSSLVAFAKTLPRRDLLASLRRGRDPGDTGSTPA